MRCGPPTPTCSTAVSGPCPAENRSSTTPPDFTADGQDTYRCGPPGDLSNVGTHRYYLIEAPQRLIYSDTIRRDGQLIAVAVLTWELQPTDHGTRLTVVDQVTSLVGQGMIDGHRNGHEKTLGQLVRWLTS